MFGPDLDVMGGITYVVREYIKAGLQNRVDLTFIPTTKDRSKSAKVFYFIMAITMTLKMLLQCHGDIYHLHVSQDGSFYRKLIILLLAKMFNRKVIVHIHGSQFEEFMTGALINRWLTKKMFVKADRVIVLSESWKSLVINFESNAKVVTVFNPIGKMRKCEKKKNSVLRVLFLGRLSKRKGTYDLLQVVKNGKDYFTQKKVKFIIAGDGDVDAVREFVKYHELKPLIDVPGWVYGDEKNRCLLDADIYVLPSYSEQMPMSILEAMASQLPIISTFVAGIPEMVKNGINGKLIKPGDLKGLSDALTELIENKDLRRLMGEESFTIVAEKFDSKVIVRQLVEVYSGLKEKCSR
jgi:glycosyltransferase involved in cell wall biosynthesis